MRGFDHDSMETENYKASFDPECGSLHYDPLAWTGPSVKISSWHSGLEVFSWCAGNWVPESDCHYALLTPDKSNMRSEAESCFMAPIPQEIQDVAAFFQYGQFLVLRFLRRWPAAVELAADAPILFLLLVEGFFSVVSAQSSRQVVELLGMKRREILNQLGFISSKSMCRFLNKINVDCCIENDFLAIKKILARPHLLHKFRHFPVISRVHLTAVDKYRSLLLYPFFMRELLVPKLTPADLANISEMYNDTNRLGQELQKSDIYQHLKQLTSYRQLCRLHDRWLIEYNTNTGDEENTGLQLLRQQYGDCFPRPPVKGDGVIVPLQTLSDLALEGRAQHHCVAVHAKDVFLGKVYIYKVLEPQRATLELDLRGNCPQLHQLKLACNDDPDSSTYQRVEEWLAMSLGRAS